MQSSCCASVPDPVSFSSKSFQGPVLFDCVQADRCEWEKEIYCLRFNCRPLFCCWPSTPLGRARVAQRRQPNTAHPEITDGGCWQLFSLISRQQLHIIKFYRRNKEVEMATIFILKRRPRSTWKTFAYLIFLSAKDFPFCLANFQIMTISKD